MIRYKDLEPYLQAMINEKLYSSKSNLYFHLTNLFDTQIIFQDKNVLDIGGGAGLYSFYAAFMKAKKVTCLEPSAEGSRNDNEMMFHWINTDLRLDNIVFTSKTLQSYDPGFDTYDIILLHDSINHLNEAACMNLLVNEKQRAIYKDLFHKIYLLANRGALLMVCDCSRYNFFPLVAITNPFVPSIEWHKHQAPEVWAELLGETGFINPKIKWTPTNSLGNIGKLLFGNKVSTYFLTSHFCLTMIKK